MKKDEIILRGQESIYIKLEPYAMKVARTVLRGGKISNNLTYLNRPYAALLLLIARVKNSGWFLEYKVVVRQL